MMTVYARVVHLARALHTAWRTIWYTVRRVLKWLRRIVWRLALVLALVAMLGDGRERDTSLGAQITALARAHLFDYATWEVDALWSKVQQELFGVGPYLDDERGHALVLDYLKTLGEVQALEAQIGRMYADSGVNDPVAATAGLRAERDALRRQLSADQSLVESIIEAQVSAVLVDEGFGVLGQVLPPVSMHFTAMPQLLVVSPRDRIAFAASVDLNPLAAEERDQLEARVDDALNVSSLVVPLGGLSLYPSMVVEPSSRDLGRNVARAFEVTAHEWAHHYLFFYPLGWEYNARAETRNINETTATFFGRAVAQKVLARYYPELPQPDYPSFLDESPATIAETPPGLPAAGDPDAPPPFDYTREMYNTRARVDFLLWQGMVEAAEAYMAAQQRKFTRNGYPIRKLNQAYFAFYGGYQGAPGAGGTDPTGPAIEELLVHSPTLEAFLQMMRGITTREELLATVGVQ